MRSVALRLGLGYAVVGVVVVCLAVFCFTVLALIYAVGVLETETRDVASRATPFATLLDTHGVRRGAPMLVAKVQLPSVAVAVVDMRSGAVFVRGAWHDHPPRNAADQPVPFPFAGVLGLRPERLQTSLASVVFVPSAEALVSSFRAILPVDALLLVAGTVLCVLLAAGAFGGGVLVVSAGDAGASEAYRHPARRRHSRRIARCRLHSPGHDQHSGRLGGWHDRR